MGIATNRFAPLGDRTVLITLGYAIDESTHRRVRAVCTQLQKASIPGVAELVPAFASVAVHYDPARIDGGGGPPYQRLVRLLDTALIDLTIGELPPAHTVEIPVYYGDELGPDLEDVASQHGLTPDDVVRIHSDGEYLVYMVGFMPGFAYMGGLDERIATPRRSSPRTEVPAGTVGIGGNQTGVYPLPSPGGWNLIGRTPIRMFRPEHDPPTRLIAGDRVRFRKIGRAAFEEWEESDS